ncbi:MAG TPA: fatty acid desaturase [Chthoniobacteraceae bacterium]|jgi:stearoyl-CoA desaturase (delta-9 desaturase)|nr:fatty acid desaturase [Chthoniobacteraceae bacterium]
MFSRIPFHRVNWKTSSFLLLTLFLSVTAVPWYLWRFGLDWFQVALFFTMFFATGLSITLGYHRLFSHLAFKANWSVRLFTLVFGAAAFENSAMMWASEHRRHHKHVDHEEDPYDISKGFFHAHMGWLMFKLEPTPPFDNVPDLEADALVRWQSRYIYLMGVLVGFGLPAIAGWLWNGASGALGGFLVGGVARVVCLQHCTFFINSACHTIGRRPYSSRCSARDSWIMALFTFGEGYHNYHHEFQHDYRNGVKAWQFDPTKWTIWLLNKLGLVANLRRVPLEKILLAQIQEAHRGIEAKLALIEADRVEHGMLTDLQAHLRSVVEEWQRYGNEKIEISKEMLSSLRAELHLAIWRLETLNLEPCPALTR